MRMRAFILAAIVLATSFAAYAVQPDEMLKNPVLEARARMIGEELRCLVCQNESIDDSNAPLAHDLRVLLRQRLLAGDSDEAARQYIVARYGDYVLLKPPLKPATLALWFGPLLLLLAAIGTAAGFFRSSFDAKDAASPSPPSGGRGVRVRGEKETRRMLFILAPIIFIAAGLLYACLGAPQLPDRPYIGRQNDPDFRLNAAAETIAAELEAHPDAGGYRHLAGMFYALHRYDRAADASQKAIDHGANDAGTWSQLGESLVMENDGAVVMDALNAFKTALARDPHDPRARFYIGLAETEIGNFKKAVAIWRDLERSAPPDAPWLRMVKDNIALYAKQGGFDPASIPPMPPRLK